MLSHWQLQTPAIQAAALFSCVALILHCSRVPALRPVFRVIPSLLWMFLTPAVLRSAGLFPEKSPFYSFCSAVILPAALVIYLLASDLRKLKELGHGGFTGVITGAISMVIAGPLCYLIMRGPLGTDCWKQIAPLVSKWVGGYIGMLSVKESVGCPDNDFTPVLIMASVVGYLWMAVLIAGARWQNKFDDWNCKEATGSDSRAATQELEVLPEFNTVNLSLWFAVAFGGSQLAMLLGRLLPEFPPVLSATTMGYLLLLVAGIGLSMVSPIQKTFQAALPIGDFGLMLIVSCLGARCSFTSVMDTQIFAVLGVLMLVIHATLLLIVARVFKLRAMVVATASMANVGGVVSGPIVADAYQKGSGSLGVIMGIFASSIAIPCGLLTAQIMSWMATWLE